MTRMDAIDPIAELKATAARPFTQAMAMPPALYTSEAVCAAEKERIFARDWICVGRASRLAKPGEYMTYDLAGQPVIVLRDNDGEIRAMSNVCLHRMSTLLTGSGRRKVITCPYHAWMYELDGTLRNASYMDRNECFHREGMRLPQVRCEVWLGWIFITLNETAEPVARRLAKLAGEIAPFGMEDYVEFFREEHVWDTNWKVLAENFMESYHLPACHAATIGGVSNIAEFDLPEGEPAYNIHFISKDEKFRLACAHPANTRLTGEWRTRNAIFSVYPSLMITVTPGYFWYLSMQPVSAGQVHIIFGGGFSPDFANDPEAESMIAEVKALLDAVNVEDRGCTERVYKGVSSRLAAAGPMSHLERPLYDFARYLAERL
ncbi:aromatic ring-hydroxylating oxygenase subunit alpha [Amaricoccus sp. W119]|uniref:aromatic ring-hydroxylating oxygenase subunit alpha n=1 Tax=Amaricoccus sp. W119 TaxID=3391833 RepID=UPI0039A48C2D